MRSGMLVSGGMLLQDGNFVGFTVLYVQEEFLLSACTAFAVCNLLGSLGSENAQVGNYGTCSVMALCLGPSVRWCYSGGLTSYLLPRADSALRCLLIP